MKTKKEVEIQLKSFQTRRDNLMREGHFESAIIIHKLNLKINTLKWVL